MLYSTSIYARAVLASAATSTQRMEDAWSSQAWQCDQLESSHVTLKSRVRDRYCQTALTRQNRPMIDTPPSHSELRTRLLL
jgi:hypothetical protein